MAVCPKCQKKIPPYHLGQNCPHCKVNLRFYDFDKQFYRDAKQAELSLAKINIFIAHVKASFIGSKLAIIRLCTMILPLVSLLAPYAKVNITQPFYSSDIQLSALGLFGAFSDGVLNYVLGMKGGGGEGAAFSALFAALASFAAVAVFAVLVFLLTVLCFISVKKMPKILCAVSCLGIAASIVTALLCLRYSAITRDTANVILSGKASFGFIVSIICFCVVFAVNLLIIKKGLNIEYKEGDLERAEIAKKVKSGEVKIEDLPQPIVETEETRKIEEEVKQQQSLYREKEGGDGDEEV
ncbi:MAG: hypothetical protein J5562_05560 [Clostridia bacterium]|nr:hypothetical protein [Clostridia bacterium]